MMAARKSRSVFQLLSRGPLAAPTLLQGAAFFIYLPRTLLAQVPCHWPKCLVGPSALSTQVPCRPKIQEIGRFFRLSGRETVPQDSAEIGRNPLAVVTPAS